MTLEQAIDDALDSPAPSGAKPKGEGKPDDLTGREREVAALIGRGLTNGQIAQELVLSKRTVEKHVANILAKLDLTSRSQIMRWAIEHDLR
ncbi:MAG TPA: helix-turn-helix transcriptional regulator [Anaerolineales bacterium]